MRRREAAVARRRPARTREHVIADLAVNHVERQVLSPDAVRRFARFRDDIRAQFSGGVHHHD